MSGDAHLSGRIVFTPPLTLPELRAYTEAVGDGYPDVQVAPDGDGIIPTGGETSARTLTGDLQFIADRFSDRAFTGWIRVDWSVGYWSAPYRYGIVGGGVVEQQAEVVWPDFPEPAAPVPAELTSPMFEMDGDQT